jgi:hypothetical protein
MDKKDAINKKYHLEYFRERGKETLAALQREIGSRQHKKLATAINKASQESTRNVLNSLRSTAIAESWTPTEKLSAILAVNYASDIAMLEFRNEVWPYEYMAFSRRIGELWEKFVRAVFDHAPSGLAYFVPPLFAEVRKGLKKEIAEYISRLPINDQQRIELLAYYEKVWSLVDSGEINLELDLHFELNNQRTNIDLKSGFGSNEKGNTNRLLMVATIYKNLEAGFKNVLLVRASEDQNNHYFRTLRDSGVWEAYCGADAYTQIRSFTGFDVGNWVRTNIDWQNDFAAETLSHLSGNNLLSYLEW